MTELAAAMADYNDQISHALGGVLDIIAATEKRVHLLQMANEHQRQVRAAWLLELREFRTALESRI